MDKAIMKTITWRFTAFSTGALIMFLGTGTWNYTPLVFLADVTKTLLYYIHEKGWDHYKSFPSKTTAT